MSLLLSVNIQLKYWSHNHELHDCIALHIYIISTLYKMSSLFIFFPQCIILMISNTLLSNQVIQNEFISILSIKPSQYSNGEGIEISTWNLTRSWTKDLEPRVKYLNHWAQLISHIVHTLSEGAWIQTGITLHVLIPPSIFA